MIDEGLLDRVKPPILRQGFYGCDLPAQRGFHGSEARPNRGAIQKHCAGAALSFSAAVFSAGKIEFVPKHG